MVCAQISLKFEASFCCCLLALVVDGSLFHELSLFTNTLPTKLYLLDPCPLINIFLMQIKLIKIDVN